MRNKKGFTLIEVLLVIVIIAILAGIVIIAVNPGRQISQANNTQRSSDVKAILDAVHQFAVESRGVMPDAITEAATTIGSGDGQIDICTDLVPTYITAMPADPTSDGAGYTDCDTYDTGYQISIDADNRVTVSAPSAELEETISITR
ncbi:MAG: type II secretion system protein [Candidatus Gracilibacteria bacterium]|nr:type II secretion system protein [Candidatus Gracilibacteria bacterium]